MPNSGRAAGWPGSLRESVSHGPLTASVANGQSATDAGKCEASVATTTLPFRLATAMVR